MAACSPPRRAAEAADAIVVTRIDPAAYDPAGKDEAMRAACAKWTLDAKQATKFFRASREYPEGTHDAFYWLPCSIKGRLRAQGREWDFEINAAATATWIDGDTARRWGCTDKACEPLVLLMPDGNEGP